MVQPLRFGGFFLACFFAFDGRFLCSHFALEGEEFFQALGVVFEAAADVDAFQDFVVAFVRVAQVFRHRAGGVEVGDGFREVHFAGKKNGGGAFRQVGLVLLG